MKGTHKCNNNNNNHNKCKLYFVCFRLLHNLFKEYPGILCDNLSKYWRKMWQLSWLAPICCAAKRWDQFEPKQVTPACNSANVAKWFSYFRQRTTRSGGNIWNGGKNIPDSSPEYVLPYLKSWPPAQTLRKQIFVSSKLSKYYTRVKFTCRPLCTLI